MCMNIFSMPVFYNLSYSIYTECPFVGKFLKGQIIRIRGRVKIHFLKI